MAQGDSLDPPEPPEPPRSDSLVNPGTRSVKESKVGFNLPHSPRVYGWRSRLF